MVKVSVIVPVYNAARYLDETLDALAGQSLRDIEVIMADDCSSDSSPQICRRRSGSDPRFKYLRNDANVGAGLTRNAALDEAVGEYVTFIDADDILHPRALEAAYGQAKTHDLDQVRWERCTFADGAGMMAKGESYGNELRITDNREILDRIALCFIGQQRGGADEKYVINGACWAALFRRQVIEEGGLRFESEREVGSEDFVFSYRFTRMSRNMGHTTDTWLKYRLTPESLSRRVDMGSFLRLEKGAHFMEKMLAADGYADAKEAAMSYFLHQMRGGMRTLVLGAGNAADKLKLLRQVMNNGYVRRICREYPAGSLGIGRRIHLLCIKSRQARLLYMLIKAKG